MTDHRLPAQLAFAGGVLLAVVFAVPYLAWTYRRRGEFGWGHALLAFAFVVYGLAIWTYALLPAPDTTPAWCARYASDTPQLRPLQFVDDIRADMRGTGVGALLHNAALPQVVFNVALFVPLGMFGRHLLGRRPVPAVLGGLLVSLFVEFTQLTGVYGLARCPYRIFDVDDLITNTLGTLVGVLLAPLLRLVPGQRVTGPPGMPRPVTVRRRVLGMAVDVGTVLLLGATVQEVADLVHRNGSGTAAVQPWLAVAAPAALLLLVVPVLGGGPTAGQRVVLLRPVAPDGRTPSLSRVLVRCTAGSGGCFALVVWGLADQRSQPLVAAAALAVVSVLATWRPRDHRGLSGVLAGLGVTDTRTGSGGTRVAGDDHPLSPVAEERR